MSRQSEAEQTRVLHIIGRLISGGVEHRTLDLIEHSKAKNIAHHVCITSGETGSLDLEYQNQGATLHYVKIHSPLFWIRFILLIRKESINVVHSNIHYVSGLIVFLAWLSGVKIRIAHFRSDGQTDHLSLISRLKRVFLKTLIQMFSTKIIGLTPDNLALAWSATWKRNSKCEVISNGVVTLPAETTPAYELSEFENMTILLHAGRANLPTKNREKAITVFAEYVKENPNAVLVFVGRDGNNELQSSDQLRKWRELASELAVDDKVHFLGHQPNMPGFYFASDILLFTSTREGLPGVVLEALAAGLPVVSSSVPGSVFISGQCSNIDILEASDSDASWAAKLHDLAPKLTYDRRIKNMKEFERTQFTIGNAVKKYTALWTNAV